MIHDNDDQKIERRRGGRKRGVGRRNKKQWRT